ncbi:MAG: hypothetical protein JW751_12340 [Polyangiaceae bacterium]|nr:hypothetical protein [Polyangiaceae bacterium]
MIDEADLEPVETGVPSPFDTIPDQDFDPGSAEDQAVPTPRRQGTAGESLAEWPPEHRTAEDWNEAEVEATRVDDGPPELEDLRDGANPAPPVLSAPPSQDVPSSRAFPPSRGGAQPVTTTVQSGAESIPPHQPTTTSDDGLEDPNDGLESLPVEAFGDAVVAVRRRASELAPGIAWDDERPAATFLSEQAQITEFAQRAAWFEAEATAGADSAAKARGLLLASELWAMCGELERARSAAEQAVKAAPGMPLATRQVRWLASLSGDLRYVSTALEIETRASAAPAARLHAACLNAEVRRIALGDVEGALQRADLAARLDPSDPRPHLLRLADRLGESNAPPRLALAEDPALDALRAATHELCRRRGVRAAENEPVSPSLALEDARQALLRADAAAAADALTIVARVEGLERGAWWLASSLLAHQAETRPQSIRLLAALLQRERTPAVIRAMVARCLEQGDAAGIQAVLAPEEGNDTFSAADRVALGVLAGARATELEPWLSQLAREPALHALALAVAAASGEPSTTPTTMDDGVGPSSVAVRLGRALGGNDVAELTEAHDAFLAEQGESPLARLLGVELALLAKDARSLATQVAAWPAPGDDLTAVRDRQVVSAILLHATNRRDEARSAFEAALAADPTSEMLARALAAKDEPDDAAARLVSLADRNADENAQALLLVEAAIRSGHSDATYEALLRRAAETQPDLPFAANLGEVSARRRGDVDAVVDWLRLRRLAATDTIERAFDATREALLIADSTPELAVRLLDEALTARPEDVGLHALAERLAPAPNLNKGHWRESLAASSEALTARALLDAARIEYELAGATEEAYRAACGAARLGSALAAVAADRLAATTSGAAELAERWTTEARAATDGDVRLRAYARLAELESTRGDEDAALTWSRASLSDDESNLAALRRLEHAHLAVDTGEKLEPIASRLALVLDRQEAVAHAVMGARLRAMLGRWGEARELVQTAYQLGEPSLWTLRQLSAHARTVGDDEEQLAADRQLLERANRAIDAATLALRAGEAAARLERLDEARGLLERAVEMLPEHFVALTTYAEILESTQGFEEAATVLEALARACQVDAHRVAAWHQAGTLWHDKLGNADRARTALEQAALLDPGHEDVFQRLQSMYVQSGDRAALAELLERRLAETDDPEERVRLEVTRGRALAEVGDRAAAKSALAAALDANPDHIDALDAYAELCIADADWAGAEQAWIRLARHASEPERQAAIYRKLGTLYENQHPNPQRAELAYLEVLKRHPTDVAATVRLIEVYGRLDRPERSVERATELINRAGSPEETRDRTLELAGVYERIVRDRQQAEATLDKARKAWPHDGRVLRAVAEYYQRKGETKSLQVLLERSANDARRALHTGRFDPAFFDVLASVAEIRGGADAARIANATVAALTGDAVTIDGAGPGAGNQALDDLLAPEMITLPLRALLRKTGALLDRAFGFDLGAVRAAPLAPELGGYVNHVQQVADAFELEAVEVLTTAALGSVCVPARTHPPGLVFGQALLDSTDDAVRFFLLLRNLKILQANAGALSRAAPIDLWPILAAFLHSLCPSWKPTGVDARRFGEHQQRLSAVVASSFDADVPALALEVAGSLGSRASQLGTAINQWGNRTALLAVGDLNVALRAIALSQGHSGGPPASGVDRMKWITRNPEARDLAVFSVSEAYAEARQRLDVE